MKKLYFLLFLPLLIYYGCTGSCRTSCTSESCSDLICGKYSYTMSDTLDNKLIEGIFNISDCNKDKISGTYTKDKVFNDSFPGFNSMKGFFNGNVDIKEKKAFINTNPKIADNNVFINIVVKKDSLAGRWTFSTMKGAIATGKFYAVKIKK